MGTKSVMAIFTIAVLLAGTIGYATSLTLPTADASQPKYDPVCIEECAEIHLAAVEDCTDAYLEAGDNGGQTDLDVKELNQCLNQAEKAFNNCQKTCQISHFDNDDDDDDDDDDD